MPSFGALPPTMPAPGGYEYGALSAGSLVTMAAPAPLPAPLGVPAEALRQQAAAVLQHCYRWLESAVPLVPQTAEVIPAMISAVQQYEGKRYDTSLAQGLAVLHAARQLRAAVPALPPL
ncbi:MAG TPA: hypothetical protein VES42_03130 [Pilimelia sp.]|nr:hypothetical protein [Pilimelia sp.]